MPDCLIGSAWVIDGDTIIVAGKRVRLHGIDAPELDQMFWCRGQQLACGTMALAALEALTAGVKLRCEIVERDQYGRLIAKCFSPNGIDVGRRLVSAGWALAYRRYSMDYVDAEDEARKARRGLWRGSFTKPWVWRASRLPPPRRCEWARRRRRCLERPMRRVGIILGWFFMLATLAVALWEILGRDPDKGFQFRPAGELWNRIDANSLGLVQVVIERYLWPPLWDPVLSSLLELPAIVVPAVPGLALLVLCHTRPKRKRRKSRFR